MTPRRTFDRSRILIVGSSFSSGTTSNESICSASGPETKALASSEYDVVAIVHAIGFRFDLSIEGTVFVPVVRLADFSCLATEDVEVNVRTACLLGDTPNFATSVNSRNDRWAEAFMLWLMRLKRGRQKLQIESG